MKIITKNICSIFTIICFIGNIICLFFYIFKRISPLKIKLNKEMKKNKTNFAFNINNLLYPPIRKTFLQKLSYRTENGKKNKIENKRKKNKDSNKGSNFDDNIIIYSNVASCKDILDSSPKSEISDSKLRDELKHIKKNMNKLTKKDTLEEDKKEYSDFELNELEYTEAIKLDKRSLLQIYCFTLKRQHLILTFINCHDYNLLYIKISRCIFLIVTHMALNAFFIPDYTIHKLCLNNGKYDFCQQIP